MSKLVSVIVPTIGRPKYLKSTIDSILRQDYENIEILVSDNAPHVSSREILGDDLDSRIHIVTRTIRLEFSEHMNLCINEVNGFYVMILSDDDLIHPKYISELVTHFEGDSDVMVGLGNQVILDEVDFSLPTESSNQGAAKVDGLQFTINALSGNSIHSIYTYISLFARTADVRSAGSFRLYADGSNADNYLFHSLAWKGRVVIIDQLMGYRIYASSTGLSTPFDRLYLATDDYDKDISRLICSLKQLSYFKKVSLRIKFKISSLRMMRYRLSKLYRNRLSRIELYKYKMKLFIGFLPKNILSACMTRDKM